MVLGLTNWFVGRVQSALSTCSAPRQQVNVVNLFLLPQSYCLLVRDKFHIAHHAHQTFAAQAHLPCPVRLCRSLICSRTLGDPRHEPHGSEGERTTRCAQQHTRRLFTELSRVSRRHQARICGQNVRNDGPSGFRCDGQLSSVSAHMRMANFYSCRPSNI